MRDFVSFFVVSSGSVAGGVYMEFGGWFEEILVGFSRGGGGVFWGPDGCGYRGRAGEVVGLEVGGRSLLETRCEVADPTGR